MSVNPSAAPNVRARTRSLDGPRCERDALHPRDRTSVAPSTGWLMFDPVPICTILNEEHIAYGGVLA